MSTVQKCREKPYVKISSDLHYSTKVIAVQNRVTHSAFVEKLLELGLKAWESGGEESKVA